MSIDQRSADWLIAGSWELNLAKSSFSGRVPVSERRHHHWDGEILSYKSVSIGPDGLERTVSFAARQDGTPFAVQGNPMADTIAITKSGPRSWFSLVTFQDRVVRENHIFLSADERMLVSVGHTLGEDGSRVASDLLVYDRG